MHPLDPRLRTETFSFSDFFKGLLLSGEPLLSGGPLLSGFNMKVKN